jgi:hypothetical protein
VIGGTAQSIVEVLLRMRTEGAQNLDTFNGALSKTTAVASDAAPKIDAVDQAIKQVSSTGTQVADVATQAAAGIARMTTEAASAPTGLGGLETAAAKAASSIGSLSAVGPIAGSVIVALATAAIVAGAEIVSLGDKSTATGEQIRNISISSGQSVAAVSNLRFAVDAAGGSLDQANRLLFTFEERMATSSDRVDKGLRAIGSSLQQIEQLPADQRLGAISDAFRASSDNVNKAAAAVEIFGQQGRTSLPLLLQPLSDLEGTSRELGNTWSEVDAAAAAQFSDAIRELNAETDATWMSIGRSVGPVSNAFTAGVAGELRDFLTLWGLLPAAFGSPQGPPRPPGAGGPTDLHPNDTPAMRRAREYAAQREQDIRENALNRQRTDAAVQSAFGGGAMLTVPSIEPGSAAEREAIQADNEVLKEQAALRKAAQKALEQYQQSLADVTTAESGYAGVLDTVDGRVVEAIRDYLQHGARVEDLARVYGQALAPSIGEATVKVEQIKKALEDETKAAQANKKIQEEIAKIEFEGNDLSRLTKIGLPTSEPKQLEELTKAYDHNLGLIYAAQQSTDQALEQDFGDTIAFQIAKVEQWRVEQQSHLNAGAANWRETYDAIEQSAQTKIAAIIRAHDPLWQAWKSLNADMRGEWASTFEQALNGETSWSQAALRPFLDLSDGVKRIFAGMLADIEQQFLSPFLNVVHQGIGQLLGTVPGFGGASSSGAGGLGSLFNVGGIGAGATGLQSGTALATNGLGGFGSVGYLGLPGSAAGVGRGFSLTGLFGGNTAGTGFGLGGASTVASFAGGALLAGSGIAQLFTAEGKAANTLAGLQAGAGIGTMILPGIGTAIGAGAGALAGFIKGLFGNHEVEDIARDAGGKFGQEWSDTLQKTIKANVDKVHDEVAGELLSLPDIIKEHPIDTSNVEMYTGKVHDLFVMIGQGHLSVTQVTDELDQVFPQLAAAATDAYGRISADLKTIVQLNQQYGTDSKAIAAWQASQAGAVLGGVNAVVAAQPTAAYDAIGAKVASANDDINQILSSLSPDQYGALVARLNAAYGQGYHGSIQQFYVDEQTKNATGPLPSSVTNAAAVYTEQRTQAAASQGELQDLGAQAVGAYATEVATGKSPAEALKDESAALTQLQKEYQELGIDVNDVALKSLFMQNSILQKNPTLIAGIDGLSKSMVGLDNLNLETADSFAQQERIGESMFERLKQSVAELGGSDKDALEPMQEYLHNALIEADRLHVPLDKNTQAMIDQSKQLGIWKDDAGKAKTPIDNLIDAVQRLIDHLNGIPDKKSTEVDVHTKYSSEGTPPDAGTPRSNDGGDTGGGPIAMAAGGFMRVTRPTLFVVGEEGPEDAWFSGGGQTMSQRFASGQVPPGYAVGAGDLMDAPVTSRAGFPGDAQPAPVGGDVTFNFSMPVQAQMFDVSAMKRLVQDYILPALHDLWRQSGGARRDTRVVLGIS